MIRTCGDGDRGSRPATTLGLTVAPAAAYTGAAHSSAELILVPQRQLALGWAPLCEALRQRLAALTAEPERPDPSNDECSLGSSTRCAQYFLRVVMKTHV